MKSNVVKLRPNQEFDLDEKNEFDLDEKIEFDGGDGGGTNEVIIRGIHEYPENEEKEPESKSSGIAPFIYGALIGWWLG